MRLRVAVSNSLNFYMALFFALVAMQIAKLGLLIALPGAVFALWMAWRNWTGADWPRAHELGAIAILATLLLLELPRILLNLAGF